MTVVATGTTNIADILNKLGVTVTSVRETEIGGKCPVHLSRTGKEDGHPSWSMNAYSGLWICYSCGARGTLLGLVQELTGSSDAAFDFYSTAVEVGLQQYFSTPKEPQRAVDWSSYETFADVPSELLLARSITPKCARLHGIRWDTHKECFIIPIVAPNRDLMGWQLKNKDWVRNYPLGIKKSTTLFGIERFRGGIAILLESPLDVVRLSSMNFPIQGLATFGSHVSDAQLSLLESNVDKLIVAMDNDDAGLQSSKKLFKTLPRFRQGTLWLNYEGIAQKDIGDMSDSDIYKAVDNASAVPSWCL